MANPQLPTEDKQAPRLRKSKPRFKERVGDFLGVFTEKNSLLDKMFYSAEESFDDATYGSDDIFYMKSGEGTVKQHIPIKMEGLKELWKQSGKPDIAVGGKEQRAYYSPAANRGLFSKLFQRDLIAASDPFNLGMADKNDIISELAHGLRYQDPKEYGYKNRKQMLSSSEKMREVIPLGSKDEHTLYETSGNEEYDTHSVTEPIIRKWLADYYSYNED